MLDHVAAAQELIALYSAVRVLPAAYHGLLQPHLTGIVAAVLADDAELSPGQRAAFHGLAAACHWDLPGWILLANTPGVKRWPPVNVPPELAYEPARLEEIAVALRGLCGDAPAKPEAEVENPPPKRHRDVRHSPDFTEVNWHGERYLFTKTQARAIEILWRGWETGGATVAGQSIVKELDLGASRTLAGVFRGSKAWGTLIIPSPVKGAYRLNDPADPVLQVARENKPTGGRKGKRIGTRIGKRIGTRK